VKWACHQQEFIMKTNIGGIDRILRITIGVALVVATLSGAIGWWGWIGLVPFLTALAGWCPLYTLLGFNSCSRAA
jgi:hypothetical protein